VIEREVTKAVVTVQTNVGLRVLMSIKRDRGRRTDGKLEFLGGRLDEGENPKDGLLRELSEEESTGMLARVAGVRAGRRHLIVVSDVLHYVYVIHLVSPEHRQLVPHPDESLGFRLVSERTLTANPRDLTSKTRKIFKEIGSIEFLHAR
jgi:8-oxo-dGTP pyrophosphatase MutT (NUDIX family)